MQYIEDWKQFTERMGFFINLKDAYFTLDNDYILSVWRIIDELWKSNLMYRDYQVVPCDPVLGSTMSDAELDLGYKETQDPSLYVKFPISSKMQVPASKRQPTGSAAPPIFLLVWTTTPWTLTANVALALSVKDHYALLHIEEGGPKGEAYYLICAQERLAALGLLPTESLSKAKAASSLAASSESAK